MQLPAFVNAESKWPRADIFSDKINKAIENDIVSVNVIANINLQTVVTDNKWLERIILSYINEVHDITGEKPIVDDIISLTFIQYDEIRKAYIAEYVVKIQDVLYRHGPLGDTQFFINNYMKKIEYKRYNEDGKLSLKDILFHILGFAEVPQQEVVF